MVFGEFGWFLASFPGQMAVVPYVSEFCLHVIPTALFVESPSYTQAFLPTAVGQTGIAAKGL